MGRKDYIADVADVSSKNLPSIVSVAKGGEDGEVHIRYAPPDRDPFNITIMSTDVSSYPSENGYYISTDDSVDLPAGVDGALELIQQSSMGTRIQELLSAISGNLGRHFSMGTKDNPVGLDSDTDIEMCEGEDSENEEEDEYPSYTSDEESSNGETKQDLSPEAAGRLNRRIRADLRAIKRNGLRVGVLDGAKADSVSSLISISTKVDKLGLSEEAIQAWDLEPQQYIILLVRYRGRYQSFEDIISEAAAHLNIDYRIGVGKKYKPTLAEALAAFTDSKKYDPNFSNAQDSGKQSQAGFSSLFISSSMNEFVNQSLITLVKIRNSIGVGWAGAKSWYNENQSRMGGPDAAPSESVYNQDALDNQKSLPDMLSRDHFTDHGDEQVSFPLVAAQFTLRYLVRCTEYCLVCHDRIEGDFEALKPYVCDKPLCLYQYMSLGFGPSVEHEILTQPYVVDLLTSFCYAGAMNQRLREYPTGMALLVPPVTIKTSRDGNNGRYYTPNPRDSTSSTVHPKTLTPAMEVKFDAGRQEIIFDGRKYDKSPVKKGDWVVVSTTDRTPTHHRVEDTMQYPCVTLSKEATAFQNPDINTNVHTPATTPPPQNTIPAYVVSYSENFDDMDPVSKAEIIVDLLKTLPSLKEMRTYLLGQSRSAEPSLRSWNDRISPAALGILRWIVASNRSCIVQVDKCPDQDDTDATMAKVRLDQRIAHIGSSYVQFRFAQGSPDKEQRFLNALKAQQANLNTAYPTIFAWHGSALQNWHSIIRSGLDYKDTLNGRAYGHGVYHARDQTVSSGYSAHGSGTWQGSSLKIASAMSLNEIVNCPTQFASHTPYYVVQHIDWIQCRYLLVQVSAGDNDYARDTTASVNENRQDDISQDPKYRATSTLNKTIGIPSCAITTSKRFRDDKDKVLQAKTKLAKLPNILKRKHSQSSGDAPLMDVSDSDEMDDIAFFLSDSETGGSSQSKSLQTPLTDFVPGSLDHSTLPMLDEPSYATPMATKALQRNLKEVLAIQKKTPLHELGWYLDERLVNNMYQWIVELHSFDPSLPLAKDMKASGVTSIVLEIRFGKDYPHSPPFVRVIRPRFLPFSIGGGGHVTAGGAMCMELLTNSGWSAVSSIESVLLQVRMAMMNLEPKPARLEGKGKTNRQYDYQVGEAIEAYKRACLQHGWQIPSDFGQFSSTPPAYGTSRGS
ncbi:hypothetical protein HYFRA_00013502 [Hymenoscyphus fraxineus]|uniref:UBC core domain-containing protein n=1 Tax=Hymenoscyphus fraxineus TaxID=746836 RepID=A0A9N9L7Q8_9HELO|nr:hypothetical protein HYFRA_00013502 [Hymenoscyphus fraxineus]